MKVVIKKLKNRNKAEVILYCLISIAYLIGFSFFIKNLLSLKSVETGYRIVIIIFFIAYFAIYFIWNLVNIISKKHKTFFITTIITIIFIFLFGFSSSIIGYLYSELSNLSESNEVVYTSYLIGMKDKDFNKNSTIGMINDENEPEGYTLAKKIISENKLENKVNSYDDYLKMVGDLYNGKIDAIFVPSNYVTLFNTEDEFVNIENDTKIIYKLSEKMKNQDSNLISSKDFSEPISILVMGVDSTTDGLNANAAFNGDTLMLITFNPHTLSATMFSIPRDTYVPIACRKNVKNKINSAAAYGTNCVLDTVKEMTDIDIDYYVKINFKGVVDLVDALGGVDVDVQKPDVNTYKGKVCEQNSDREFGSSTVCMDPGLQTLNGEQALAYSRCRHLYYISDLARIKHQQDVVTAIGKKIVNIRDFNSFKNVISAVTKNISTNMTTDQMLSGYNVVKSMVKNATNGEEFLNINKTYLEVYNLRVFLQSSGMYSSALGYYPDSLKAIQKAMKVNLEEEEPTLDKTFSFSVNNPYVSKAIGEGITTGSSDGTLPNFANSSVSYAKTWCNKNKVKCNFEYVDENSNKYNSSYANGMISSQSIHEGALLSNVSSIVFYVNNETKKETTTNNNQSDTSISTSDDNVGTKNDTESKVETPKSEETKTSSNIPDTSSTDTKSSTNQ